MCAVLVGWLASRWALRKLGPNLEREASFHLLKYTNNKNMTNPWWHNLTRVSVELLLAPLAASCHCEVPSFWSPCCRLADSHWCLRIHFFGTLHAAHKQASDLDTLNRWMHLDIKQLICPGSVTIEANQPHASRPSAATAMTPVPVFTTPGHRNLCR